MGRLSDASFLIKYKLRQAGGFIAVFRYERFHPESPRRFRAATTLFLIGPESTAGLAWEVDIAFGLDEAATKLVDLLTGDVGCAPEQAEEAVSAAIDAIHIGILECSLRAS